MRKNILSFLLLVALPGAVLANEARILSMSGNVEVRPTREGQWAPASENTEIAEGGAIRTGADGAAIMLMPNKSKVWLKESTSLEVEQRQTLASRLALMFGRIKVRVPHLMRKEKFEVRTPAAVCAVRGTELVLGTTEDGKMDLNVLFGEVKLKFVVPAEKGPSDFYIPQGQGLSLEEKGKPGLHALLDSRTIREGLENWNPGVKPEDRQNGLKQKENDRAQLREYALTAANADNTIKTFLNIVKDSDLEAGRTLTDVHGNLVRVDQRMIRPSADEVMFLNLVKRPVYDSQGAPTAGGFAYNVSGPITDRLDYMQLTLNMNQDLPQRIEEWPAFFKDNTIKPEYATFIRANRLSDNNGIFFVAQGSKYVGGTTDKLVSDGSLVGASGPGDVMISGVITDDTSDPENIITAVEGLNKIAHLGIADNSSVSLGSLKYNDEADLKTYDKTIGGDSGQVLWAQSLNSSYDSNNESDPNYIADRGDKLFQYQAKLYGIGGDTLDINKVWLASENYVIGNGGDIKDVNDLTNSGTDPFTLLKNTAAESVLYVKNYDASGTTPYGQVAASDKFSSDGGYNVDLVFIPDLLVAAVQRILPAITEMNK